MTKNRDRLQGIDWQDSLTVVKLQVVGWNTFELTGTSPLYVSHLANFQHSFCNTDRNLTSHFVIHYSIWWLKILITTYLWQNDRHCNYVPFTPKVKIENAFLAKNHCPETPSYIVGHMLDKIVFLSSKCKSTGTRVWNWLAIWQFL